MATPYSYVVVRYVPDQGAGEGLNIGVVVHCGPQRFIGHKVDTHYERLSRAFAGFDGQAFRRGVAGLLHAFREAGRGMAISPLLPDDRSMDEWLRALMPDVGGSVTFTPIRHGITDDPSAEVALLFERMVESQKGHPEDVPRRDDAQVWRTYQQALSPAVSRQLRSKSFTTASVKIDFEHAVKNGNWHVIQPISMDYRQAGSMQRKASQWVGATVGLQDAADLGTVFFVLGQPAGHAKAYERAKALLSRAPVHHEIIEEGDAEHLNRRLLALLEHIDG